MQAFPNSHAWHPCLCVSLQNVVLTGENAIITPQLSCPLQKEGVEESGGLKCSISGKEVGIIFVNPGHLHLYSSTIALVSILCEEERKWKFGRT